MDIRIVLNELAVIPYLLNNCDTWYSISEKSIEKLDKLQNTFYRKLLKSPIGEPHSCILLGMWWPPHEKQNFKEKFMLLHHIENLDKKSYAYLIYDVQKRLFLPGLISECQPFLTKLDGPPMEETCQQEYSKV